MNDGPEISGLPSSAPVPSSVPFTYDSQNRLTSDTWYNSAADADAGQNAQNEIQYQYDSQGRITRQWDNFSSYTYTYDSFGD